MTLSSASIGAADATLERAVADNDRTSTAMLFVEIFILISLTVFKQMLTWAVLTSDLPRTNCYASYIAIAVPK